MNDTTFQQFENGTLIRAEKQTDIALCAWIPHKDFAGVYMKNVVTAEHTGNVFTCHLVRIEPHHKIGMHTHTTSIELHEVIQGSGICLTEQGEIPYSPGTMVIFACNAPHEVRASNDGLCLFAKFITVPS